MYELSQDRDKPSVHKEPKVCSKGCQCHHPSIVSNVASSYSTYNPQILASYRPSIKTSYQREVRIAANYAEKAADYPGTLRLIMDRGVVTK